MSEIDLSKTILVVVGASLRAEAADRPLGYRIADEIASRLEPDSPWKPLVISDVLYLNSERLTRCPAISIGGPGVNHVSAMLLRELPSVLTIDGVLIIQMDLKLADVRCCLWGMNHEQTVECLELFLRRGHLDHFLSGVMSKLI